MPDKRDAYGVLIAAPNSLALSKDTAERAIWEWNRLYSRREAALLEPILYERHAALGMHPGGPQGRIDDQLFKSVDLTIGLFGRGLRETKPGEDTGAVREVKRSFASGKQTVVIFLTEDDDPNAGAGVDEEDKKRMAEFRSWTESRGLIAEVRDDDLPSLLLKQLDLQVRELRKAESEAEFRRWVVDSESSYDPTNDRTRLGIQARNLVGLDAEAISIALEKLDRRDAPIQILDAGCADGLVTKSRFGGLSDTQLTGIDVNEEAIRSAMVDVPANFTFEVAALSAYAERHRDKFDVVFCALTLHHLANPAQGAADLWNLLRPGGVLIVRGSDDGSKLTYPDGVGVHSMEWLLRTSNAVRFSSNREHGRTVYTHVMGLQPKPCFVKMLFQVDSTVGKNAIERVDFFLDSHSFRRNYARKLVEDEDRTPGDVRIANELKIALEYWRTRFEEDEKLFAMTVQNILIAVKPVL